MNFSRIEEECQGLMNHVLAGIAEMEAVREEVEEFGRQPLEKIVSKEEKPLPPPPTLSDLEEDDFYQFKRF